MAEAKPLVAIACICEKVLLEKDGVASIIRIVDTFHLQLPQGAAGAPIAVDLTAFVSIKAGEAVGAHEIGLVLRRPSGKNEARQQWPIVLTKPDDGANLRLEFRLAGKDGAPPDLGTYWWDVLWGEEVLTSIPFTLKEAETPGLDSPREPSMSSR